MPRKIKKGGDGPFFPFDLKKRILKSTPTKASILKDEYETKDRMAQDIIADYDSLNMNSTADKQSWSELWSSRINFIWQIVSYITEWIKLIIGYIIEFIKFVLEKIYEFFFGWLLNNFNVQFVLSTLYDFFKWVVERFIGIMIWIFDHLWQAIELFFQCMFSNSSLLKFILALMLIGMILSFFGIAIGGGMGLFSDTMGLFQTGFSTIMSGVGYGINFGMSFVQYGQSTVMGFGNSFSPIYYSTMNAVNSTGSQTYSFIQSINFNPLGLFTISIPYFNYNDFQDMLNKYYTNFQVNYNNLYNTMSYKIYNYDPVASQGTPRITLPKGGRCNDTTHIKGKDLMNINQNSKTSEILKDINNLKQIYKIPNSINVDYDKSFSILKPKDIIWNLPKSSYNNFTTLPPEFITKLQLQDKTTITYPFSYDDLDNDGRYILNINKGYYSDVDGNPFTDNNLKGGIKSSEMPIIDIDKDTCKYNVEAINK